MAFKDSAAADVILKAEKEILAFGGKIGHRYTAALRGFSAWIPGPIVTALSTNPFIDYIEEDGEGKYYNSCRTTRPTKKKIKRPQFSLCLLSIMQSVLILMSSVCLALGNSQRLLGLNLST